MISSRFFKRSAAILLFSSWIIVVLVSFAVAQSKQLLRPEDLFSLRNISDLELSPDGRELIYVLKEASLKEDKYVTSLWRVSTGALGKPERLTDNDKDHSPKWSPDGKKIALLSSRDAAAAQIWLLNAASGLLERVTDVPTGVISFEWSPDSRLIAFRASARRVGTFEEAIENKNRGVVIKKNDFVVYRLMRNRLFLDQENLPQLWLLNLGTRKAEQVTEDIRVDDMAWSPDCRSLAISATPDLPTYATSSSIYIYTLGGKKPTLLLKGEGGSEWDQATSFTNPLWSPDGQQLAVICTEKKDRWSESGRIGIYSFTNGKLTFLTKQDELELYAPVIYWINQNTIFLENTNQASRHLFAVSTVNGVAERTIARSDAYDSRFSFSANGRMVAFVRQSLQQPPEIHVGKAPFDDAKKMTSLNEHVGSWRLPATERVEWMAPDGKRVEGWIFYPLNFEEGGSYPLLVMVHGGPVFVLANRFEPYASEETGWTWPYPFRIFAQRGYLVFLPNYRGTGSYGKSFRDVRDIAEDPYRDIVSGITFLIKRGIVDTQRVGIMGQSHGSWLGPYVMARERIFKAASFAEGGVTLFSQYGQMPGWLNLNVHEFYYKGSPYDDPERYLALSPVFNFANLTTATLLEYGEQSLAVQGLEFLSALWRRGVPHEMIIYPKTGHNISLPILQLESINRNLDWFDYWILGKKDLDPAKRDQYERWESNKIEMQQMRTRKVITYGND